MRTHIARIELIEPAPSEVLVGDDVALRVKVACTEGCDLRALSLQLIGPDGDPSTHTLGRVEEAAQHPAEITLKIPRRVSEHIWSLSLAPHAAADLNHVASPLTISLHARAHDTSLAVWDIPSPVVAGEQVTIKVGAKSSAACPLSGRPVEIRDGGGAAVAHGALSATPWPGTSALYWTDLSFLAPDETGPCRWSVRFDPASLDLPHQGSESEFSFAVVPPPAHQLVVRVVEQASKAPVAGVEVRLGPYHGATDANGSVEIAVSKGRYDIAIWKVGFEAHVRTIDVDADIAVVIDATIVPEEDPDAIWKM